MNQFAVVHPVAPIATIPGALTLGLASASDAGVDAWINRRAAAQASRAGLARCKDGRRRFIDPTTCEREYSRAECEFMDAMQAYKQSSGRLFPTWSEVLEVIVGLGYEKPKP